MGGGWGWWEGWLVVLFGSQPHTHNKAHPSKSEVAPRGLRGLRTKAHFASNEQTSPRTYLEQLFPCTPPKALPRLPHALSPSHCMRRTPSSLRLRQSAGRPPLPNRAHTSAAQRTNLTNVFAPAGAVERHPLAASALAPFMFDLEVRVWPP